MDEEKAETTELEPFIQFNIKPDTTIGINVCPNKASYKHFGSLLFLIQSGALATAVVEAMHEYAANTKRTRFVNQSLAQWYELVLESEKVKNKHKRNPAIRAKEVLGGLTGLSQDE